MAAAKSGDRVQVHYTGKLTDGTVFDSSAEREPLEFTIGQQEVIPGFEQAIVGMEPGQKKTETIPAEQAYGPHREDMVVPVERDTLGVPEGMALEPGQRLRLNQADGQSLIVTVTDVNDETVTLDANHPLAGQDLVFEIELVRVTQ